MFSFDILGGKKSISDKYGVEGPVWFVLIELIEYHGMSVILFGEVNNLRVSRGIEGPADRAGAFWQVLTSQSTNGAYSTS